MQIICISRGGYGFSNQLAEKLSEKTGYPGITRSMILDEAGEYGLSVGKLEVQVVKKGRMNEALKMEAERYKAFVTARLCKSALEKGGLVYHGRAGHLVFPGLSNLLSVKVIGDQEIAIEKAMATMNMNRSKAKRFVEDSADDIKRWVKIMYQQDCDDPHLYNITVNASQFSVQSAADTIYMMTKLPECQLSGENEQHVKDLLLASECHLELARNEKTKNMNIKTSAEKGHLSVSYLPGQAEMAENIPPVLDAMKAVKSFGCGSFITNETSC